MRALGLRNVETLAVMDAKNLAFADSFFDAVVAQYVITAVPDPEATLDDFIRVLKPGGELILVNHIGAESGPRRIFELAFAPLARRLGWRPEFPWARLVNWAAKHGGVTPDRAPPDAADGAFLADPLPQIVKVPISVRNFRARRPFPRHAEQTLTPSLERADRRVRGGQRAGPADADDAAGPDRSAGAGARQRLRADAAGAAAGHHRAGRLDDRSADRAARRQIGEVRWRVVPARRAWTPKSARRPPMPATRR